METYEIVQAIVDYMAGRYASREAWNFDKHDVEQAFADGAEWALEHLWTSVEEKCPEDNAIVFAAEKDGQFVECHVAWFDARKGLFRDCETGRIVNATHWMPARMAAFGDRQQDKDQF